MYIFICNIHIVSLLLVATKRAEGHGEENADGACVALEMYAVGWGAGHPT